MTDIEADWTPWERGVLPTTFTEEQIAGTMEIGRLNREQAIVKLLHFTLDDEIWMNNFFQVNKRSIPAIQQMTAPWDDVQNVESWPAMIHLSIKRRDRQPLGVEHFRVLQRIKNDLIGTNYEAVELYPADEFLVDTSNQYHLWVLCDPKQRFPFGFRDRRLVLSSSLGGAVQRPFSAS